MARLSMLGGPLAAGRRWGSVSREACEDAQRDAEGALFLHTRPRAAYTRHPGALVCGRALHAGVICSSRQGLAPWGCKVPQHLPSLDPEYGSHIRVAETCLKIAVHAHISLLLSAQNLMWGIWSSGKRTVRNKLHLWRTAESPGAGRAAPLSCYLCFDRGLLGAG